MDHNKPQLDQTKPNIGDMKIIKFQGSQKFTYQEGLWYSARLMVHSPNDILKATY